ncbi:hypothetical protein OG455_40155 [Kitasatospora sp. NBC_01287]|uniref:helix-turn-helix domain-containing protein n=1 Tax=Kitasatospora sp. NBC_01287 TaxID=2903573 RepID=UPI002253A4DA|nr:helix-turn-helix domain-containing protein [Kitasatospora sp. NBC_01287]MCX4751650.1 hypothetical protein [Kitasatospora sp. NBC_01287]
MSHSSHPARTGPGSATVPQSVPARPGPARPGAARPALAPAPAHGAPAGPRHQELGLLLYRLRLERGLSLRALARCLGYSSHSAFADFEKARRLPGEPLLLAYERLCELRPGSLVELRALVLAERAAALAAARGRGTAEAVATVLTLPPRPPRSRPLAPEPGGAPETLGGQRRAGRQARRTAVAAFVLSCVPQGRFAHLVAQVRQSLTRA